MFRLAAVREMFDFTHALLVFAFVRLAEWVVA